MPVDFRKRYGAWAVVAGGSEGLGEAFARALAARGCSVALIARRVAPLERVASDLERSHGVETMTRSLDLADAGWPDSLSEYLSGLDVGVGVYNAAYSPIGDFVSRSSSELERVVDVNVRGAMRFAHVLGSRMAERGRGALVLMSSLAGEQGSPRIAAYAASKAFNSVLAEGISRELAPHGVHVLASVAGAVRTPGFGAASRGDAPGTLDASQVVERTLDALGTGGRVVPGSINALANFVMRRLLPRTTAVTIMAANTRRLS